MNVIEGAEIFGDAAQRFQFPEVPLPALPLATDEATCVDPRSAAYAELAQNIRRRLPAGSAILGFTSPGGGDGKTRLLARLMPELSRCHRGGVFVAAKDFEQLSRFRAGESLVLVDMPSLDCVEAAAVARLCDGVFLVVRLGHTLRPAVKESARAIRASGDRFLGCVVIE